MLKANDEGVLVSTGEINKQFLSEIKPEVKNRILENMAAHYSITSSEAETELVDSDAEYVFEYLTGTLRHIVYEMVRVRGLL